MGALQARMRLLFSGLLLVPLIVACGSSNGAEQDFDDDPYLATATPRATSTPRPRVVQTPRVSSAVQSMSALEQMELAFQGNPKAATIKPKMDRALRLYGLQVTEENYSRAGSVLVVLRRENGVSEMEILDHMICSHVPGVNLSFQSMAALAVTFIVAGDRC